MENKKGIATIGIFLFIFAALIIVIALGIFGIVYYNIDYYLSSQDIVIGNANFTDAHINTLGKVSDGFLNNVDMLAYVIIFSLVLFMFINAYYTRGTYPQVMLIIDVILAIFYYIACVYVANTYYTLINSSTFLAVYPDYLPKASKLIMNLPIITPIIAGIVMILSYSKIPKDENEQVVEYAGY